MAKTAEIMCINKIPRMDPNESITHVGGIHQGKPWKLTLADAIAHVEQGNWIFYVAMGGKRVDVEVAVSRAGNKYLRTKPDSTQQNNLLRLPECP